MPIHLDDMLTVEEAAPWLQMAERELLAKCKGPKAPIPAFWINSRVVRFNPRIIIAKLARDARLSESLIAASFGLAVKDSGLPRSSKLA